VRAAGGEQSRLPVCDRLRGQAPQRYVAWLRVDVQVVHARVCLGEDDAYLIAELPNVTDVAAISLTVAAAGGARITTIPLITPEGSDAATTTGVQYAALGA
jgi:hypothetical protein